MLEARVVPDISEISNDRPDIVKREYAHVEELWLSEVCKEKDLLEIDMLIGADYVWTFQSGKVVKGKVVETVSVETFLGWALSGLMKGRDVDGRVNVNFVTQQRESELKRMWDLETLGIKGGDDVHEELIDKIEFNGVKYSVKLPWKQGHERIPAYYANSLSWLKLQGCLRFECFPYLVERDIKTSHRAVY